MPSYLSLSGDVVVCIVFQYNANLVYMDQPRFLKLKTTIVMAIGYSQYSENNLVKL